MSKFATMRLRGRKLSPEIVAGFECIYQNMEPYTTGDCLMEKLTELAEFCLSEVTDDCPPGFMADEPVMETVPAEAEVEPVPKKAKKT